jgi:signal transduction histidine kinase/DNA-binding NarL/FixJ family response regulator/ligand-binding sensor domain-containing protein
MRKYQISNVLTQVKLTYIILCPNLCSINFKPMPDLFFLSKVIPKRNLQIGLLYVVSILLSDVILNAQQYGIQHFSNKDGLSGSVITCLFQDSKGLIWIGTTLGLNQFDGQQIKAYIPNLKQPYTLKGNYIIDVNEDKNGLLWVSSDVGLAVFDPLTQRFCYLHNYTPEIRPTITSKIIVDNDGNCWFYQYDGSKLYFFNIRTSKNLKQKIREGTISSKDFSITKINITEGIEKKLKLFYYHKSENIIVFADAKSRCYSLHPGTRQILPLDINTITETLSDGSKVFVADKSPTSPFLAHDFDYSGSLSLQQSAEIITLPNQTKLLCRFYDNKIYDVTSEINNRKPIVLSKLSTKYVLNDPTSFARLVDMEGNLWIGTAGNGLYLIPNYEGFELKGRNNTFYNIAYLGDYTIWQGIFNKRHVLQIRDDKLSPPAWAPYLNQHQQTIAVAVHPDNLQCHLMISSALSDSVAMYIYEPLTKKFQKTTLSLPSVDAPVMLIDNKQHTWVIGTKGNIARFNPNNQSTEYWNFSSLFPDDKQQRLIPRAIIQSSNEAIWCSFDEGILRISPTGSNPKFHAWHNFSDKTPLFSNNGFSCISPDINNPHILWLGSNGGGLCKFNTQTNEETCFTNDTKLIRIIAAIQPDHLGNLWVSSEKGLSCFNIASSKFIGFNYKTLFSSLEFNPSASFRLPDNRLVFGLWNGLLIIQPDILLANKNTNPLNLAEIFINGIALTSVSNKLTQQNDSTLIIKLNPHEKNIMLRITSPGVNGAGSSVLQFMLDRNHNNWIPIGSDGLIHLNNMPFGRHHLSVSQSSTNSTQNLNLIIIIQYPWFLSWPMRILYFILLCIAVYLIIKRYHKTITEQHTAQINAQEIKRLQFIDDYRKRFITYLTHEFKTPLTIILGLTEMMKQQNKTEFLDPIYRESNQMLALISEMIDIIKVEDGSVKPQFSQIQLHSYINDAMQNLSSLAALKNIIINTSVPVEEHLVCIDPIRTRYIINNLVSNAIRFSPEHQTIDCTVNYSPDSLTIAITNRGQAIAETDLPHIFDKYYQTPDQIISPNNFGIGLAFVKELVTLLNGSIEVLSNAQNTTFTLKLPTLPPQQQPQDNDSTNQFVVSSSVPDLTTFDEDFLEEDYKPSLLICEDNPVILSYLEVFLRSGYEVLKARNGQEGFEFAQQHLPDLIITDVVMPVMDGLELTEAIKKHPLTCHIPVVIISGKDQTDDIISGKSAGADAYLTKPFHFKELLLTLRNIQSLKKQWKDKYNSILDYSHTSDNTSILPEEESDALSSNNHFISELMAVFEQNYHLDSFDLNQMAKILLLSRTQLYRKITSFSTESPMTMLRNFRLNKAAQLLTNNPDMPIRDIATATGFKERTHFNALFVKKFHLTPSEWRKHTAS